MEPATVIMLLTQGVSLSQRIGVIESEVARSLHRIEDSVQNLLEAPLHEGLRRLRLARVALDDAEQVQLLREARQKFDDASVRDLRPLSKSWALTLSCLSRVLLGSSSLARHDARAALIEVDKALAVAEAAHVQYKKWPTFPWEHDPRPDQEAGLDLARTLLTLCRPLGVQIVLQPGPHDHDVPHIEDIDGMVALPNIPGQLVLQRDDDAGSDRILPW